MAWHSRLLTVVSTNHQSLFTKWAGSLQHVLIFATSNRGFSSERQHPLHPASLRANVAYPTVYLTEFSRFPTGDNYKSSALFGQFTLPASTSVNNHTRKQSHWRTWHFRQNMDSSRLLLWGVHGQKNHHHHQQQQRQVSLARDETGWFDGQSLAAPLPSGVVLTRSLLRT